jgi:hypothetical protein
MIKHMINVCIKFKNPNKEKRNEALKSLYFLKKTSKKFINVEKKMHKIF